MTINWQRTILRIWVLAALLVVLIPCLCAQVGRATGNRFQSYDAFGDSIAEGCCVSGGTIIRSAVHNNVATLTVVSSESQPIPAVGDILARVTGTANGEGALNFMKETPIIAVGGEFTQVHSYDGQNGKITGTISFALQYKDLSAMEEHGSFHAATYVSHIAAALNVPVENHAKSGTSCADMGPRVFALKTASGPALYTLEDGVNDIGDLNAGSPQVSHRQDAAVQFVRCTRAEDVFLSTPGNKLLLAGDIAAHAAGWFPSTLKDPAISSEDLDGGRATAFQMMSNVHAASFAAKAKGTAVVVAYEVTAASDGKARVKVDNGPEQVIATTPPCLSPATSAVSLSRKGNIVTAHGSLPNLQARGWVIVQRADSPGFNGTFVVKSVDPDGATWVQTGEDAVSSARAGVNLCAMTQSRFGRTFSPQAIIFTGLSDKVHLVKVTVTSASGAGHEVYLDYLAGNDGVTRSGSTVVRVGVERAKTSWMPDELTGYFDAALKEATRQEESLGWHIRFADVRHLQNTVNGGNIAPRMFAEKGGRGTFASGSSRVTDIDPNLLQHLAANVPIDDNGHYLPIGSSIKFVNKDGFVFSTSAFDSGALASGNGYFNLFPIGVHPNNRGQIDYFAASILTALGVSP